MMFFKDFLQWVRSTGERYVVLDADGEPEFVIEPFQKEPAKSQRHSGGPATIPPEADLGAGKFRDELHSWDTMADATLGTPSLPSSVEEEEKKHDEPTFQFETIDE
ncbi:MAG: hypothetical protein Q7S16_02485 [bacterium]|nr:hypothetical protein [bacterium]